MSIVEVDQVYRSRWGFHPCSRATFLKLKAIHKAYWQAVRAHADWKRWHRKEPQNRIIREYLRDSQGRKCGVVSTRPRPEPQWCPVFPAKKWPGHSTQSDYAKAFPHSKWCKLDDHGILNLYQQARRPSAEPVPVWQNLEKIDRLYAELVANQ